MVVRKEKNHMGTYDIIIEEEGQTFIMTFQGNLDLYCQLIKKDYKNQENVPIEITKENYTIYGAFERLFSDIENCNVYKVYPKKYEQEEILSESEEEWFLESLDEEKQRVQEMNEKLKECRQYEEYPVFKQGEIKWHCDDEPYKKAPILTISKKDDKFLINITNDNSKNLGFNSVRIRNSGSRYSPYNTVFMRMFNELQNYDPDYHQVHFDELEYQKKLQLKR